MQTLSMVLTPFVPLDRAGLSTLSIGQSGPACLVWFGSGHLTPHNAPPEFLARVTPTATPRPAYQTQVRNS